MFHKDFCKDKKKSAKQKLFIKNTDYFSLFSHKFSLKSILFRPSLPFHLPAKIQKQPQKQRFGENKGNINDNDYND